MLEQPHADIIGQNIDLHYGKHQILFDVSFTVQRGTITGLVGESGSGKSTLAKALVGILQPTKGELKVLNQDLTSDTKNLKNLHRQVQMIPQDPYSSLNPRRTIGQTLAEAISPKKPDVVRYRQQIVGLLERMQLPADSTEKLPYQFSGGQRQRIAIARALAVNPKVIIADEITSALDVSVQAEILELITTLVSETQTTMLFISHNLAVVSQVCDQVLIMESGRLVEQGAVRDVYLQPKHPYTENLLDAIPGSSRFSLR